MSETGWKSKEAAERFSKVADVLVPGRREILSLIARLATARPREEFRVLDLGCGYGDVTAEILQLRPDAAAGLVDVSDEMIRLSTERFKDNPSIRVLQHDLNAGVPEAVAAEQFDAVVSCDALHHVEFANRVRLYAEVRAALAEGGLFVNADRFREESPFIATWTFDGWIEWSVRQLKEKLDKDRTFAEVKSEQREIDQRLGDKPGTIWETQQDLKQAGFRHVDCLWKRDIIAVIVATGEGET